MELKLGSIPLKIQGRFFLMVLLLGLNEHDPARLGVWVAIVLVSVVIHELGHALVGRAFGLVPRIELHGMGGHTFFTVAEAGPGAGAGARGAIGTGKSIAISLAGPFAGFLFALVVLLAQIAGVHPAHPLARHAVSLLFFVNIGWGIFNLLPMLPLDGGNVMRAVLTALTKKNGERASRFVSIGIAGSIALWALTSSQWWVLYLGVLFGFQNVQALRQTGQLRVDQTLAEAIEKSYGALDRKEPTEAIALLEPVLVSEATAELRQIGLRVYVVSLMKAERWTEAMSVIERDKTLIGPEDLGRYAQTMREFGREADADRVDELGKAPTPINDFRS